MRERRFRSWDSRISFFAFADIITAVSGMLIFITLLLATDLGRPTDSRSQAADSELERQLQETLTKQAQADAENRNLQQLLVTANTAPAPAKLESDITRLRVELADEKSKHAGMAQELAASKSTLDERDKLLGITALRERITNTATELEVMAQKDATIREETVALEQQITNVQSKTLKYRARAGQTWLIPDRSSTTKEPVLTIVSGKEVTIERFDRPDLTQHIDKSKASPEFESFLRRIKPGSQYIVFLIRPSGIGLFKDMEKLARAEGYEVGFDALEEDREIHFTRPPPIDDEAVPGRPQGWTAGPRSGGATGGRSTSGGETGSTSPVGNVTGTELPGASPEGSAQSTNTSTGAGTNVSGTSTSSGTNAVNGSAQSHTNGSGTNAMIIPSPGTNSVPLPPPPKPKSWWQRFLEWLGIG